MSYTNPDKDQDSYALYELEFEFKRGTTVTSPDLLLLMGGHLALSGQSGPVTLADIRYDNSKGASFISGGPYHFKLDKLDGISLGNQDNQIQSGAITIFVASRCTLADNINTCAGSILDYSVSTNASGATIAWTIEGSGTFVDASGAPTTPGNTTAVKVKASDVGSTAGTFTVTATITAPGFVGSSCSDVVTVNPLPTVTADDKPVCVGSTVQLTGSPSGGTWSGANVSGSTFNAAGLTAGTYTVTYSFTSAGGCTSTDNATITVNDLPTAGITGGAFCKNGTTQLSITSGPTTGNFSASPSGLSIDSTGLINLAASTLGTYTVTYSFSDANSCSNTTTSSVTVNDQPAQPAVTVVQPSCSSMTGTVTVTSPVGPNVEYSNQGGAYQSEATFTFNAGQGYSIVARTKNTECKSAAAVCTPDPNYPVAGLKASPQLKQAVEAPEKIIQTEAYPNPTGSDATINFSVPKSGRVLVNVYNSMGKQVGVLFDGEVKAGEQRSVVMKGGALPTGTYYYRVTSHGKTQTNRISLAK